MKLTSFTREKTQTGNFSFLEFGKGKAFVLSLLMLSLVVFSTSTATAGGFFEKMFKKAQSVMVVQPLAIAGVDTSPFVIPGDGVIDIMSVCACDDGLGGVVFHVTMDDWPAASGPYDVGILYTNNIPPNTQVLSVAGVPANGTGQVTITFPVANNALLPAGNVAMVSVVNQVGNVALPINATMFGYTVAAPLAITCPAPATEASCQTQAAIDAAFATWLTTVSTTGGCNVVVTNDSPPMAAPPACGGATTVTWTATDDCGANVTCSATFTVTAAPPVVITCPAPATEASCQTQAAIDAAFATWMGTFSTSGGCNPVVTNDAPPMVAPPACGGATTVTWTVTSDCEPPAMCSATFTVTAAPPVVITCPAPATEASCQTQAAIDAAFATWLTTATLSGGCGAAMTHDGLIIGAPAACGGASTVTWTATSDCEPNVTCSATFTVTAAGAVAITCPVNTTASVDQTQAVVNADFATWLASVSSTGGCGTTISTSPAVPTAPDVCTGGTTTVTFTATPTSCGVADMCTATYTVPPTTLAAAPVGDNTSACDAAIVGLKGNATGGSGMYTHGWAVTGATNGVTGAIADMTAENTTVTLTKGGSDGTLTLTYTLTDNTTGCITSGTVNIFVPVNCPFEFDINDPCICNDDADVNADNGTFMELVTVVGPGGAALPAGLFFAATNIVGAFSASPANEETTPGPQGVLLVPGQALTYCGIPGGCTVYNSPQGTVLNADFGSYYLAFTHVDAEGYTIQVQGPALDTDGDPTTVEPGNITLSISNMCQYPEPNLLNMPAQTCVDDAPFLIQGNPVVTGTPVFFGDATFVGGNPPYAYGALPAGFLTDNMNGTAVIDPGAAAPGCYTISYTYQDNGGVGTQEPGCFQAIETTIFVAPADDPTFAVAAGPFCPTAAISQALNLTTVLPAWPACAPGTDPTPDERVNWYGGDGTNVTVTDNADASGTLDIIMNAQPGVYTICAETGVGSCQSNYCVDIVVNPNLTAASAALTPNFNKCLVMNEVFDLGGLLEPGAIPGGTFGVVTGGAVTGMLNGALWQYLGGDGTLTVTYTVTDCDANIETDQVVITIDQKPYGEFALAASMCQDGGVVTPSTTSIPTGAAITFTSSPAGFVTNAATGLFNPAAGPLAGECVDVTVTMTVTNNTPAVCPAYSVSQVVRVCASGNPAWIPNTPVCEGGPIVILNLTSTLNDQGVNNLVNGNVTWTGEGVGDGPNLTGTFNPASAGVGVHNVCVTVGSPGCEEVECHDIVVLEDFADNQNDMIAGPVGLCLGPDDVIDYASYLAATAFPGGTFTVVATPMLQGVNNPNSYEYNGGCGSLTITYTLVDCLPDVVNNSVVINISQKPDVGDFTDPSPMCVTDAPTMLNYSGTFHSCGIPPIGGALGSYAAPASPVGTIIDGGNGITAIFNPAAAGEGTHMIIYTLIDPAGICTPTVVVKNFEVRAAGSPVFTIPNEVCFGDVNPAGIPLALTAVHPSLDLTDEVVWFGGLTGDVVDNGITGVFTPSQPGTYTICVETGDTDCTQTHCEDIIVWENVDAGLIAPVTYNCQEANTNGFIPLVDLSVLQGPTSTPHGTWSLLSGPAGSGIFNDQLDGPPGCYNIQYTVSSFPAAAAPCLDTENTWLRLTETPNPSYDMAEEICWDGIAGSVTIPTEYNGQTFGTNGTLNYAWTVTPALNAPTFSNAAIQEPTVTVQGAGVFEVCLTETIDYPACGPLPAIAGQCSTQTCHTLTITETNVAVLAGWNSFGPVCVSGPDVDLDARVTGTPNGVFTGLGVELDPAHPGYKFNPGAAAIVALLANGDDFVDVSVCYTVGNGAGCDAVQCHTIRVYNDVVATLNDITQCNDANTQIDLTAMFGATTDDGGVFSFTGGAAPGTGASGPAGAVIAGDILTYPQPATGDFTFNVTYTVGTNPPGGACMASDAGIVTILHSAPTTASCPVNIVNATPAGPLHDLCGMEINYATPTWNDDCDGNNLIGSLTNGMASGAIFPVGVTTVTWNYIDQSDNDGPTCTFTVTITDATNPVANCLVTQTFVLDGSGQVFVNPDDIDNGSYDNCGIDFMEVRLGVPPGLPGDSWQPQKVLDCDDANVSGLKVQLRVTDNAGNQTVCEADVAVKDFHVPDIECPGNIYVGTDPGQCAAIVNYPTPTVEDNCTALPVRVSGPASGWNVAVGEHIVTWKAEDTPSGNNVDQCSFLITVFDDEMPVIVCDPAVRVANNDAGVCSFTMPGIGFDAGTSDNCAVVSFTHDYPVAPGYALVSNSLAGAKFPVGITDVLWTSIDAAGNKNFCTIQLEISDTENPVIANVPADMTVVCGTDIPAVVHPNITDNCLAIVEFNEVLVSLGSPDEATLTRTWNVIDPSGNTATASQTITILDNVNPVISNVPADMTVTCGTDIPAVVHPTFSDNCDEYTVDFSEVLSDNGSTDESTLVRTWVVTDAAGNTATASQTITIDDNTDPVISNVPADMTVTCGTDIPAVVHPTITDNCSEVFVDFSEVLSDNGSTDESTLVRTWVATDAAGNTATASQTITIDDNTDPVISNVPADMTVTCGTDIPAVVHPTITDNCDEVFVDFSEVITTDGSTDEQVLTRTWVATDAAGNSATASQVITIDDNTDPVISNVPQDITVTCASDIPAVTHPTITDNCDEVFIDFSETLVDEFSTDEQVIHRTWVATDAAGNSSTATQVITVLDTEAPVFSNQPADATVDCGSDIPAVVAPTITDNCSEFTVDFSEIIVDEFSTDEQILVRTWVATDEAGNQSSYSQTITINDTEAPAITSQPSDVTVDCGSDIPTVVAPVFTDNCTEFTVDFSEVIVDEFSTDEQILIRTWVATDEAGNSTTVTQTITINDGEAPAIVSQPADVTVDCGSDIPTVVAPVFTDNCTEFTVDFSEVIVDEFSSDEQILVRTWVATDEAGNSTTVTQTITINDGEAPAIVSQPADMTVDCGSDIPTVVAPVFTDNCDEFTVDFSEVIVDEFSSDEQVLVRTWVATDEAGNSTTVTQTITILDTEAPAIVSQPADETVTCGSDIPAVVAPVFTDNCGEFTVDFSEVLEDEYSTDNQVLVRTWVATDEAGNSTTVTQTITINDDQAPVIVSQPADDTVDCGSDIPTIVAPVFIDNCSEFTVDFSQITTTDQSTDEQIIVNTWVATDEAGNSTTVVQIITIDDNEAPVITDVPADVTVNCGDEIPAVVTPTITDNCDEVFVDFSETITTINFGSGLVVTRTWVATDAAGNTTSATQVVTVDDTVDPVITCSAAATSFGTDPGECSYKVTDTSLDPTASDNCDVYTITHNYAMAPQSNSLNGAQFPVGSTSVGFTVTDAAGNTAECTITIDVADTEAPAFVNCPTTMVMVGNDVDVCSGKLNWSIPVATDNCDIQLVAQTGGPASGTAVPVGTSMTVTYTATDISGNANTCTFDVLVVDTQKPEFDADIVMPGDVTVECDNVPAPFVLTNDDVYDNCTASADLVINFTGVSTKGTDPNACDFYNYTMTRTWTVTDMAGNVRTHVQIITVQDTTAPTPTCADQSITLDLFGNASIDPVVVIAGTTDNCAGFANLTVTASQVDFDCSDLGDNTITLTIMDPCGNTATCVINVEVIEGAAPCTPIYDINGSDPCVCLDNATNLENGQFGEVLQIQSLAGQTWTVQSSIGLYTTSSPAPPAAPFALPAGTVLSTVGNGTFYRLDARHVDAIGFSVTLVNNVGQVFTFSNVCHYPTPVIDLPSEICLGTDAFVPIVTDLFAGSNAYTSIEYFIDGVLVANLDASNLGLGQHTLTVVVNGGTAASFRTVNGVLIDTDDPKLDPGCEQSLDEIFQIVSTPSQVTCNDLINLTIDADCVSEIYPDQVLEGSYACFDDYTVHLFMPNGIPLNPVNVVNSNHIGITLNYILVHPISGNTCWGTITVEDKNDPVITCPPNVEVLCTVDPDSVVHWVPFGHPGWPAQDYYGNLVPAGSCDSLLYFGHPDATDCSAILPLNCQGNSWTFNDDYTVYDCAANPALIADIVRTFIVEDEWGNFTSCEQFITWKRGEADDVVWPDNFIIACNDPDLDALVDSDYSANITGWPYINDNVHGKLNLLDNGICNLGLTYNDQLVNLCANEYKVVRTWTLFDWCPEPGNPTATVFEQFIKVDNLAPVITVDCYDYTSQGYCVLNATEPGNMPHYACSAIYVPFATIDAVCDDLVEVSVETPLGNTTNGGILPSPGLPLGGPYEIVYRAEDQCGNITEYILTVMVEDHTAPIAICDEITDVNLGINGEAVVFAETFDDGSWDGCCLEEMLVARMESTCGSTSFGPSVSFNCCDIDNAPTMVIFRAVDCFGNTNDCMVQVNVNDKTPPVLVSCPASERVSCDWYAEFFETQLANAADDEEQCDIISAYFGDAVYLDNCDPDVACNVTINLDQCLEGFVRRTWTAMDASGNSNSSQNCNQTIWVDHVSDFVVEFPVDLDVECGTTPPDFGEPEIFYETCELVAVSYEDEIFTDVPGACYKLVRQWTVINWCVVGDEIDQEVTEDSELDMRLAGCLSIVGLECDLDGDGDCDDRTFRDSWAICNLPTANEATDNTSPDSDPDSDPWDGYITYQQTIKVNDTVDPVFTNGCDIDDVCIGDNTCDVDVTLPTPDIDECSSFVTFSVTGDLGTGFGPFFNVAPGTYNVKYIAMDNCNNQTACETTVTVADCKKPTPYCKNGIVVELMVPVNPGDEPMVEIWAVDLDANSFDNCTAPEDLIFSFSANTNDLGVTYNCDHVGQQSVEIWVTDEAGNQDFCETVINVQANMNQCNNPSVVNIGGSINTEDNEGVQDVDVQLSGAGQMSVMTDDFGSFSFPVTPGGDFTVTPSKDDDHLNGVTTFDLVIITKHILGVSLLDSPYKMIAADANKSGSVTTFDLVQIRKLILYIDDSFPSNTSWRFVDKDYSFPQANNPWAEIFPEISNYNNVDVSVLDADFVAVKIGDVNGSAQTNFADAGEDRNTVGSLVFNVEEQKLNAGETYTVDFKANDFDVLGYQFTLNFDQNAVEFVEVAPAIAGAENFGMALLEEGVITASWNDNDVNLAGDQVIFSLVFNAVQDVELSNAITVNSRYTVAEAYNTNGELLDVELAFNGATVAAEFELYQNTPNPFSKTTVIGFTLPEASTAKLTITDVSGKVVKVQKADFAKGYNEFKLERSELTAKGILYYQLDTDTDSATKMMILID